MIIARGISHDFNNILTILNGKIALAKMIVFDESIVTLLSETEKVCVRASDLNHQLMEFSKGDSSTQKIVHLSPLIKSTAKLVLKDTKVRCYYIFEKNIPPVVGHEVQFRQVFLNLIINAVQAMSGYGTITIGLECVEMPADSLPLMEGTYVRVYIKDEGVGIPERLFPKIFTYNFSTKLNGSG